jgi:hypothetical protein
MHTILLALVFGLLIIGCQKQKSGLSSIYMEDGISEQEAALMGQAFCAIYIGPEVTCSAPSNYHAFWLINVNTKTSALKEPVLIDKVTGQVKMDGIGKATLYDLIQAEKKK